MAKVSEEAKKMFEEPISEDVMSIVKEFVTLKSEYKMRSELLDQLKEQLGVIEASLVALMQSKNMHSVKMDTGESVIVARQIEYSVSAQDRQKQIDWVQNEGMENLLSVNYRSWNSFCKKIVEEGKAVPEFVRKYEHQTIQTRGVKI